MRLGWTIMLILAAAAVAGAGDRGGRVQYIGGTITELGHNPSGELLMTHAEALVFRTGKTRYAIPWSRINLLEYGQRVNRRYALGVVVSPLLALSKSRKHYVTIAFQDDNGGQQALVFRVDKDDVRSLLVSLEARTNLRVEYQDEDARKAGKG
ncbi:MAG: hypothetical protein KIT09_11875 [Bryobacteraceae bacterium]|nr:hypothetical protein [Bryobacteraceae bacterium]